jgi:hypothetical protein
VRHAAAAGRGRLYRPLWSRRILDEVEHAILIVRPQVDPARPARRIQLMTQTFEDAEVSGWEQVAAGLDLPDPHDRHVLAAAIGTANLKHFPAAALLGRGIEARHPDEFLLDQLHLHPSRVLEVLTEQAAALRRPPTDLAGLLNHLERCQVPDFVEAVRRLPPENL